MAFEAYMTINGETQGDMSSKGLDADSVANEARGAHEDEILVTEFDASSVVPRDPNSGKPTSNARPSPVRFKTLMSRASPMLWQALDTNEPLEIEVDFYRVATAGNPEHFYTYKFTGAILVEGKTMIPQSDGTDTTQNPYEEWSFTYATCDQTHEVAGTSSSEDRTQMT